MSHYIVVSEIEGRQKVECFYLEDEIEEALEELDKTTIRYLGADYFPFEDGTIGFYASNGNCVFIEEVIHSIA